MNFQNTIKRLNKGLLIKFFSEYLKPYLDSENKNYMIILSVKKVHDYSFLI